MIQPTDPTTHNTLLRYHAGLELNADGQAPAPPQTTRADVERELVADEWTSLVTGNGDYVPAQRMGRSRPAPSASGASEDNR